MESREDAVDLILQRESYGALIIPNDPASSIEVLTAPAANKSVATMVNTAGEAIHNQRIAGALKSGKVIPQALNKLTQQSLEGPKVTEVAPLSVGATAALLTGLHSLAGYPGISIGAVITMFLGNPLSGSTLPLEFLPWHFEVIGRSVIGRSLVPGATQELLRTLSYFPEAGTTHAWWTLITWITFALACLAASRREDSKTGA